MGNEWGTKQSQLSKSKVDELNVNLSAPDDNLNLAA
jgi:hypothetical protein